MCGVVAVDRENSYLRGLFLWSDDDTSNNNRYVPHVNLNDWKLAWIPFFVGQQKLVVVEFTLWMCC